MPQPIPTGSRQKVAWPVQIKGKWRVRCSKCGVLPGVYKSWTTAATGAWKHGRH